MTGIAGATTGVQEPAGRTAFVAGGTLSLEADCYLERAADRELLACLLDREYACVLDHRIVIQDLRGTYGGMIRSYPIPL